MDVWPSAGPFVGVVVVGDGQVMEGPGVAGISVDDGMDMDSL